MITHVCFIALTLAGSLEQCLNTPLNGLVFKQLPRDPANVHALKNPRVVPILIHPKKPNYLPGQPAEVSVDLDLNTVHTHYYNSNLIWRTVSRRVDEVIPSDHPRRQIKLLLS